MTIFTLIYSQYIVTVILYLPSYLAYNAIDLINLVTILLEPDVQFSLCLIVSCSVSDKATNRTKMLSQMFKATNEVDTGQNTNNPYILAKRHFDSDNSTDIDVLNNVLAYHGLSVTPKEFDIIQSLNPVSLPYPLPNNDLHIHSVVGPTTKRKSDMVAGTYVLSVKEDSRQYVGGSVNLSTRLRTYYNTKAKVSGRTMAVLMSQLGPTKFSLQVYVIPFDKFSALAPLTKAYKDKLVLAVEQYFILQLKPVLNDMLVVGGGQTKNLGPTLGMVQSATTINSKLLYVYDIDKVNLLYISPSRIEFQEEIGMNTKTQWKHIMKDMPIFNTYYLTDTPIEGANTALMTTDELRASMSSLYLSNKGPKHPVKLTDLSVPVTDQVPIIFASKTKLLEYTVSMKRPVGKVFLANLPCRHNGWLVEVV